MRGEERLGRAFVWALFAAFMAGFAWSTGIPDTSRDIFMAYQIRHGIQYPMEGPYLGMAMHFGPAWFYLVALPLWVSESWLSCALFQGALCALKFPLAYYCGRKLHSREFGLLWAAALALPGWSSLQQLIPFNASPVETACFLILAAYLRCLDAKASGLSVFMLGLSIGFAAHIHPTTAPFAMLALHVLYRRYRAGASVVNAAAALACGAALLFMPYVISQASAGWSDWRSANNYVAAQVGIEEIRRTPDLIIALFHSGPRFAALSLAEWQPWQAGLLEGICALFAIAAFVAAVLRSDRRARILLGSFTAAVVFLSAWVAILRTATPFYFLYVIAPPAMGIVGLGAYAITSFFRRRGAAYAFAALCLGLNAMVTYGMAVKTERGDADHSAQVLDVKNWRNTAIFSDVWFPALHRSAVGRVLCAAKGPVSLHGALAYVEDRSVGLDALLSCGRMEQIALGGTGAGTHLVGITRPAWGAVGANPKCWTGPLGIVASEGPFWPAAPGQVIADGNRYFPREVAKGPALERTIAFATPGPGIIVVTNLLFGYERVASLSASAAGRDAGAVFTDAVSWIYTQDRATPGPIEWQFRVAATSESAIDIAFIPARSSTDVPGCAAG
jgi:hypothetical protein